MSAANREKFQSIAPPAAAILESISDAFYALDNEWRFTYVNREAERLIARSRSDLVGQKIWDLFPDLVDSTFHRMYQAAKRDGISVEFVEYYSPLHLWFEVRAYPAEDLLAVYFHDITARKANEQALRLSRQRLDLALSSFDLGLWYCDLPFDKLVWNERTKEHFGLPADSQVTIDTFYERLHPDDRARTSQAIERAIQTRELYDIEYRTVGLDGRLRWIRAVGRASYDDAGVANHFDGITVDITGYKNLLAAEQEARSDAETLNLIGKRVSAELDLEKLVQAITDAATEVIGASFGSFFYNVLNEQGESYMLYSLSGVPREAFAGFPMPRNTAVFAPTFRGDSIVRSEDITKDPRYGKNDPHFGMPQGHLPVRSYLAVPVASRSGEVIGGLFFGHKEPGQFTEHHERIVSGLAGQAAIAMDNARLFDAVKRAREEADRNAGALAKSKAELQQMTYVASHDLQEPLRTVSTLTQLFARRYRSQMGEDSDDLVDKIVGAASRMKILIDNVLEYSRLESPEAQYYGPVDMNSVLSECIKNLAGSITDNAIEITHDPLPSLSLGNRTQLTQLLQNLLSNSLKYASPNRVLKVHVSAIADRAFWQFAVTDNGQGFSPDQADRIFGMFKRLHGREVPGTGIGLTICKRIVELHGGRIWAESRPDQGATFFFTLLRD